MEIEKLADVIEWADGIIRDAGFNEEKYKNDAISVYCHVKAHELWKIRDVVLKGMERHSVYTNALNKDIADKAAKIDLLEKELDGRKAGYAVLKEQMDTKYISIDEHNDICKAYESENESLKKQNEYLTKELNDSYKAWEKDSKNHQKRDMTLVDELAGKNDKIKSLVQEIEYYKNQERIRTDQLRATESKVEELWKRIEKLEEGGDDHGRTGFKKYIEWLIEEEERAVPERFKARLNEEITEIFEEEETEVKGVGRTSSGRYPLGAEVHDIPCCEDSIE